MNSPCSKSRGPGRRFLLPGPGVEHVWACCILAVALSWGTTGCTATRPDSAGTPAAEESPPPLWGITGRAPELPQWPVCAIGLGGPTYFRGDGVEAAIENARSELARTLQVRIETRTLDIQTEGGGRRESQTVTEVSSYVNDIVLQGSTIIGLWYDKTGEGFAKKPRCTYALVCIDEASLPTGLSP